MALICIAVYFVVGDKPYSSSVIDLYCCVYFVVGDKPYSSTVA